MHRYLVASLGIVCLVGCGAEPGLKDYAGAQSKPASPVAKTSDSGRAPTAAKAGQQIIYRATLLLHVEDFGAAERKIAAMIQESGGYLAQFREDRPYGAQRGGKWTVRIPTSEFDRFLNETAKLGIAEQREVHADDVTEEYVDLTARLKNKEQLESRLLELVANRTDEIKDVLAIETELSRVREEIERMQGRLRYLTDRVALTTVEITAYERHNYTPPEAPTFAGKIATTFGDSLASLRRFAEGWVLVLVALGPWLVVLAMIFGPLVWYARRRLRRMRPPTVQA